MKLIFLTLFHLRNKVLGQLALCIIFFLNYLRTFIACIHSGKIPRFFARFFSLFWRELMADFRKSCKTEIVKKYPSNLSISTGGQNVFLVQKTTLGYFL